MRRSEAPARQLRVLCFGSREWRDEALIDRVIGEAKPGVVIAREARGADQACRRVARRRRIPLEPYRVEHDKDGPWPEAGKRANARMLRKATPVHLGIGFVVGGEGTALTPGSRDMLERLLVAGISVIIVRDGGATEAPGSVRRLSRRPS